MNFNDGLACSTFSELQLGGVSLRYWDKHGGTAALPHKSSPRGTGHHILHTCRSMLMRLWVYTTCVRICIMLRRSAQCRGCVGRPSAVYTLNPPLSNPSSTRYPSSVVTMVNILTCTKTYNVLVKMISFQYRCKVISPHTLFSA